MPQSILTEWTDAQRAGFRRAITPARHTLHEAPQFTDEALAELIDRHPDALTDICTMGDDPADQDSWRGGDRAGASGAELMQAVRAGKLWINLRHAMSHDEDYKPLFDRLFDELKAENPGYVPMRAYGGILISSPKAQVFYHADVSETLLLHVKGKKRFRIYPPQAPWLTDAAMEDVLHLKVAEDIPYRPEWDADAWVKDMAPGDFISWPLHAPHRVENLEGLNVSITIEVVTKQSLMKNAVLHANGALRTMGWTPRSSSVDGPQVYAKFVLSRAFKLYRRLAPKRPMPKSETTFDVDLAADTGYRDRQTA